MDITSSFGSFGLKGIESVTLDYKASWPISLLLSRRAITKYQLLSRLLFFSKHVELRVLSVWSEHQRTKSLNIRAGFGPSYCLRQRMLHFLQNFVYYVTLEVITPHADHMQEVRPITKVSSFLDNLLVISVWHLQRTWTK